MDFKIGDDIEENTQKKPNKKLSLVIIIILSIIMGLTVFLVSNTIFGEKKREDIITDTKMDLEDENVKILYQYVKYGTRNTRNDKFIKEQNVKLEDFNNYEKFYYALQFAEPEDFANIGKVNENGQKIYNISSAKVKQYMQRFFGPEVTYSTNSKITYPFNFKINNLNVGVLTYAIENEGFNTVFVSLEDDIISNNIIEPYYTKLTNATKKSDGSLELNEKIIYTELINKENNTFDINIYKDYQHTILLESKLNLTELDLKNNPINIEDYQEKAATISYLFKLSSTNYYFDSSKISN